MKFTSPESEVEFANMLHPEARDVATELEEFCLGKGFGELTLTEVIRTEAESERIYLPLAKEALKKDFDSLPVTRTELAWLQELRTLSEEGVRQWARRKFSWHKRGCSFDLRTRDKTSGQLASMKEWVKHRCQDESKWELILETHGTGPHFHIARKSHDWRGYEWKPTPPTTNGVQT